MTFQVDVNSQNLSTADVVDIAGRKVAFTPVYEICVKKLYCVITAPRPPPTTKSQTRASKLTFNGRDSQEADATDGKLKCNSAESIKPDFIVCRRDGFKLQEVDVA